MPGEQTTQTTQTTSEPPANTQPAVEPGKAPSPLAPEPAKSELAAQPPAPLTLEAIKLPEGVKSDDPLVKEYVDLQNDTKLSQAERANKLLELYGKATKAASEQGSKAWDDLRTNWQKEIKNDPEIGGAKFEESHAAVGRVLDHFGDKAVRDAFDTTGAGDNPAIFKFLVKIGGLLKEGTPKPGTPSSLPKTHAEILYPNQGKT